VTSDGRIISGPFFAHMMKDCPEVKSFQVHQLAIDQLLIKVVLEPSAFPSKARIERIIRQYMGENMKVVFEMCDAIPLTVSGKRRITISHLESHAYSAQPISVPVA